MTTEEAEPRQVVRVERDGDIAVVVIDNPPVNAGSAEVRTGLLEAVEAIGSDDALSAAVIIGAGRAFVSGADIREFDGPLRDPQMPAVIAAIERCAKPVVAAIHGAALGGGLELALGCDRRIATADAAIGFPEISLGVVPGAGGTQRAPRLAGMMQALGLIATAKRISGRDAADIGLVDRVSGPDLRAEAVAFARSLDGGKRRVRDLPIAPFDTAAFDASANAILKAAKGREAVAAAIDCVRRAPTADFDAALGQERATFQTLRSGPEARALRHLFFAERNAARAIKALGGAPASIGLVGVVGAGAMGAGIALAFARSGYRVCLTDRSADAARAGLESIAATLDRAVRRSQLGRDKADRALASIAAVASIDELTSCDLIVEAVFEDMDVKRSVFAALDRVAKPGAVLASNTSYLDLDAIAAATGRPDAVVGLHFFIPADASRLIEIVRGARTSADSLATALAVARRLKKSSILAGVGEGFIGNRVYAAYRQQAEFLLEEGAYPEEVDAALTEFGMAMGVFAVSDFSGLDIAWARRKRLAPTRDRRHRYVEIADRLCEMGRFGRKTGAGWYAYADSRRGSPDPIVRDLIEKAREAKGITPRTIAPEEIVERMMAGLVNETALLLAEGVAQSASDVDLAFVRGYGFPETRGGPVHRALNQGEERLKAAVARMLAASGGGVAAGDLALLTDKP